MGEVEVSSCFRALYTKHKTQKRKTWQDGTVRLCGGRLTLLSDEGKPLGILPGQRLEPGLALEFENFLCELEEQADDGPAAPTGASVQREAAPTQHRPLGLGPPREKPPPFRPPVEASRRPDDAPPAWAVPASAPAQAWRHDPQWQRHDAPAPSLHRPETAAPLAPPRAPLQPAAPAARSGELDSYGGRCAPPPFMMAAGPKLKRPRRSEEDALDLLFGGAAYAPEPFDAEPAAATANPPAELRQAPPPPLGAPPRVHPPSWPAVPSAALRASAMDVAVAPPLPASPLASDPFADDMVWGAAQPWGVPSAPPRPPPADCPPRAQAAAAVAPAQPRAQPHALPPALLPTPQSAPLLPVPPAPGPSAYRHGGSNNAVASTPAVGRSEPCAYAATRATGAGSGWQPMGCGGAERVSDGAGGSAAQPPLRPPYCQQLQQPPQPQPQQTQQPQPQQPPQPQPQQSTAQANLPLPPRPPLRSMQPLPRPPSPFAPPCPPQHAPLCAQPLPPAATAAAAAGSLPGVGGSLLSLAAPVRAGQPAGGFRPPTTTTGPSGRAFDPHGRQHLLAGLRWLPPDEAAARAPPPQQSSSAGAPPARVRFESAPDYAAEMGEAIVAQLQLALDAISRELGKSKLLPTRGAAAPPALAARVRQACGGVAHLYGPATIARGRPGVRFGQRARDVASVATLTVPAAQREHHSCYGLNDLWLVCGSAACAPAVGGGGGFCELAVSSFHSIGTDGVLLLDLLRSAAALPSAPAAGGRDAAGGTCYALRLASAQSEMAMLGCLRALCACAPPLLPALLRPEPWALLRAAPAPPVPSAVRADGAPAEGAAASGSEASSPLAPRRRRCARYAAADAEAAAAADSEGASADDDDDDDDELAADGASALAGAEAIVLRVLARARLSLNPEQLEILRLALRMADAAARAHDSPLLPPPPLPPGAEPPPPPIALVHGLFGTGKSTLLASIVVGVAALGDALALRGARRPRLLLCAATNVAVDSVLLKLLALGHREGFARVGALRRIAREILPFATHAAGVECASKSTGAKQAARANADATRALTEELAAGPSDADAALLRAALADIKAGKMNGRTRALKSVPLLATTCASSTCLAADADGAGAEAAAASVGAPTAWPPRRGGGRGGGREGGRGRWRHGAGAGADDDDADDDDGGGDCARDDDEASDPHEGRCGRFDLALIDEASQMLEPQTLLPLARSRARFALLVGDPKQLPPTVSYEPTALSTPLFVRLAAAGVAPLPMRTQYRLHPALSAVASSLFYAGQVVDGVAAAARAPLLPGLPTLCLHDTTQAGAQGGGGGGGGGGGSGGVSNAAEAVATREIVRALLAAGLEPGQLGVICLYRAQAAAVSRALGKEKAGGGHHQPHGQQGGGAGAGAAGAGSAAASVMVSTVDAFQGAERDVIIVTAARTSAGPNGSALAFVANPNRLCVALTRARRHLILVCSASVLAQNGLWAHALRAASRLPSASAWGSLAAAPPSPAAPRADRSDAEGEGSEADADVLARGARHARPPRARARRAPARQAEAADGAAPKLNLVDRARPRQPGAGGAQPQQLLLSPRDSASHSVTVVTLSSSDSDGDDAQAVIRRALAAATRAR